MDIKDKVRSLPESCGVYIFRDIQAKILYIGKANSLKKRVSSYFNRALDSKTQALVEKIADLEYRLTDSESGAQVLEAALVREHMPQYNIDLKDDKSFPWIKVSAEDFPVVSICRRKKPQPGDKSLYLGPYTNPRFLRQALKLVRRIFGFRSCRVMPKQACLYYRVKLCPGPCVNLISRDKYSEIISRIKLFLDSRYEELIGILSQKMRLASKSRNFEEAAKYRDQIDALSAISDTPDSGKGLDELEKMKSVLKLEKLPLRIEGFDISNISGKLACGSMVSFYKGLPDKNNYRRFRIKTVSGINDYEMLREVVSRRYSRILAEKLALPDLVLIDGGKGHLQVAQEELQKLGLVLPLISIAKEKEHIFVSGMPRPLKFKEGNKALNLIRRVRDESHRFALSYHHVLRRKNMIGK